MTSLALSLVLAAAVLHATWNLLAKRATGGAIFVWLFSAAAAVIYAPLTLIVLLRERPSIDASALLFLAGSPLLNAVYFLLLQRGYRSGDFSLIYPLVRGSAPLLTTVAAIVLFSEEPAPLALAGTALIVAGVVLLAGSGVRAGRVPRGALLFGLVTGASIAAYTLWDKHAVSGAGIPPAVLNWAIYAGQALILAPLALRRPAEVRAQWQAHRRAVLVVAVLSPMAYLLVLSALAVSPVSYVAPAREISILLGVLMGSRLLAERNTRRRMAGAGVMVAGVIGLAVA